MTKRLNPILVGAECAGATLNMIFAKQAIREGKKRTAVKYLKEAQNSMDFIFYHMREVGA